MDTLKSGHSSLSQCNVKVYYSIPQIRTPHYSGRFLWVPKVSAFRGSTVFKICTLIGARAGGQIRGSPHCICSSIVQVSVVPTCSSVDSETNVSSNTSCYEVRCDQHILTTFIIPDVLLITSFAYGLYIFRWIQTEQLATLTEAVSPDSSLFLPV